VGVRRLGGHLVAVPFGRDGDWKNNFGGYSNPEVDGLIVESKLTLDFEKRRTINRKLHSILAEEQPYTFLWTLTNYSAYHRRCGACRSTLTSSSRSPTMVHPGERTEVM